LKYWYDTEFIEDGKTIDLISIGMVREDGRELYAISTEFNPKKANDWVKQNVLVHLPPQDVNPFYDSPRLLEESRAWKSPAQIRESLLALVGNDSKPEFWGYYSAYDHVALCQLFGTMMDLPKGWPFYTRDIKQWCDELGNPRLPEQGKNEHHALADARWNREAWQFLLHLSLR
jgi:3'-5' exoribonuclease Rv2179c-like domain